MHYMLMDLLHGFEVLSTTEETLFNSRLLLFILIPTTVLCLCRHNYAVFKTISFLCCLF